MRLGGLAVHFGMRRTALFGGLDGSQMESLSRWNSELQAWHMVCSSTRVELPRSLVLTAADASVQAVYNIHGLMQMLSSPVVNRTSNSLGPSFRRLEQF